MAIKKDLLAKLYKIIKPEQILTKAEDLIYASLDKSSKLEPIMPQAVLIPNNSLEFIAISQTCLKHKQAVVIRGAGTGKSGGALAVDGAIVIDISKLNKIIKIDTENFLAEVEPGVILGDLKNAVKKLDLFYPPDPASQNSCTLGGNVAENASGPSTLKYGSTKDYVLGGQVILGTGELIDFGKRCPKGVAGYDIASLLTGSEGTLGIFTKFILRLLPMPKDLSCGLFYFNSDDEALSAVNTILLSGHLPRALEFIDKICLTAVGEKSSNKSALLIECDASYEGGASRQLELIEKTIGSRQKKIAYSDVEIADIWAMRSKLSEACSNFLGFKISEDIAVPLGVLSKLKTSCQKICLDTGIVCGLFGHAGDGNLHVQLMFGDDKLRSKALSIREQILHLVIELRGTLSAEHGIGLQKKEYLCLEQSDDLIALQKRIKAAFDPDNLLNPGKIFN